MAGVRAGDRTLLSRAITLIESGHPDHRAQAQEVLQELLPATGGARRDRHHRRARRRQEHVHRRVRQLLTEQGHQVAVLAVDPSSTRTGGSILGDKTRMGRLAVDPAAFVRPSPSGGTLGGVARMTRETMLLCEAAGFDVVLVETVGVGQSETMVAGMVDLFLALMLPGAGDELQGIKKGLLEIADLIAVNKADGDNLLRAQQAVAHYRAALRIIEPESPTWRPSVWTVSASPAPGCPSCGRRSSGTVRRWGPRASSRAKRRRQQVAWMWSMLEARLMAALRAHPAVRAQLPELEQAVAGQHGDRATPWRHGTALLAAFGAGQSPEETERTAGQPSERCRRFG